MQTNCKTAKNFIEDTTPIKVRYCTDGQNPVSYYKLKYLGVSFNPI